MFSKTKDRVSLGEKPKENKFKTEGFVETELKQLENDASALLNSIGTFDIPVNRDLGQLKELLSKNIHDGGQGRKRRIREGNGRRLLASEKFNHGLIENQLMNLKQDFGIGAKATSRKIYRVRRNSRLQEPIDNEFNELVEKVKKRGIQYELNFIGKEDKKKSDKYMYQSICAEIKNEFARFEGKHKMNFDSFINEEMSQKLSSMNQKVPKDLTGNQELKSSFSHEHPSLSTSKHDTNTKAILDGYFKGLQKFLEDANFDKKLDVKLMQEFYDFERGYQNSYDSFDKIWEILLTIFKNIDYISVQQHGRKSPELRKRITRNTCEWFEKEFSDELMIDAVIRDCIGDFEDENYIVNEQVKEAVTGRIQEYLKDFNYNTKETAIEYEDDNFPVYAVIYF